MLLPAVALGATLVLTWILSCFPVTSDDLWWHLATGRWIAEGHGIPRTDLFSYTALGHRWVTHEWLTELLFHGLRRLGGVDLLVVGKATAAALAIGLAAGAALIGPRWRERIAGAALGALLAGPMISPRAFVRPHMMTALLLGVLLLLLRLESHTGRRRWRVALIPLFLVWANLHAGFVLGLAVAVLYWGGEALAAPREGRAWRDRGLMLGLALLATFANPNFARPHLYGFQLIARPEVRGSIVELRSLLHPAYRGAIFPMAFLLSLAVAAVLARASRRRRAVVGAALLPAGVFAILAVASVRNLSEYAVLAPLAIGAHGAVLAGRRRAQTAVSACVLALAVTTGAISMTRGIPVARDETRHFGLGVEPGSRPDGILAFLERERPAGELFHPMSYGGAILDALGPERKVFADGRLDVYPPELLRSYEAVMRSGQGWEDLVRRYGITMAIVTHARDPLADRGLGARLRRDPEWTCVLAGDYALLYMKRTPENRGIVERYGLPFDPVGEGGGGGTDPLSGLLASHDAAAIARASGALASQEQVAPKEIAPRLLLGRLLDATGRSGEAIAQLREAARLDPANHSFRMLLAETLQRADSLDSARALLEALLREDPKDVEALSILAMVERAAGRAGEALSVLERAAAIDPANAVVEIRLGVLHAEAGRLDEAERHLRRAAVLSPNDPAVQNNLRALETLRGRR
ncbi:MAG: tetratricopeptide repeat protein [Candidatus Eisenbacteria bacterium]